MQEPGRNKMLGSTEKKPVEVKTKDQKEAKSASDKREEKPDSRK